MARGDERPGDEASGAVVGRQLASVASLLVETPCQDEGGGHLDTRVESERNEADRRRGDSGRDGDDAFNSVPADREAVEQGGAADDVGALVGLWRRIDAHRAFRCCALDSPSQGGRVAATSTSDRSAEAKLSDTSR